MMLIAGGAQARKLKLLKKAEPSGQALNEYLQQVTKPPEPYSPTVGSLWNPAGAFSSLARDYKAQHAGDLITINISENTSAQASGTVKTSRDLAASSGLAAFFGTLSPESHVTNLFSPSSTSTLNGSGATASSSVVTTSLTGTVVRVLPNGNLVVQVGREVLVDNQRQKVTLRGVVRPGDIAQDNSIPSTAIGDVVLEITGKGIISDGTRPPNILTRTLLRLFGF